MFHHPIISKILKKRDITKHRDIAGQLSPSVTATPHHLP